MATTATRFPVSQPRPSCPWLVFNHGEKEGYSTQTIVNIAQARYDVASIPEMRNKIICTSSHGWLVLWDFISSDCSLLNPVSMENIALPPLPPALSFMTCILSSPPTDPECVLIFFKNESPSVFFLRLGESKWTAQDLTSAEEKFKHSTVCGGKIHGLNFRGDLLTAKVVGSNLVVTRLVDEKLPNGPIPELMQCREILVESCGELFRVAKHYYLGGSGKTRDIEIHKMDFSRLEWTKVENLGNRAFFLSGSTCNFSCSATAESGRVKQNCIYFTEPEDRDLYVFDIENYSISFSTPCPIKSNWLKPAVWVMPA
ncbi:hypothetical protein RHMOL_Rhmol08G0275000 [Rhododendron molle]|uniref:Uncharacterized protein n=1 Tax=Rhododendron molle TaxID=49168 RepID=A0ACC0MV38_RHOML|nr:hypothetical protein RHMOL_Rhmol08G0275000 [Rhododendron molle]